LKKIPFLSRARRRNGESSSTGGTGFGVVGVNSRKPDGDLLQYLQIFGKSKFFGPKRPRLKSKGQQCSLFSETKVKND